MTKKLKKTTRSLQAVKCAEIPGAFPSRPQAALLSNWMRSIANLRLNITTEKTPKHCSASKCRWAAQWLCWLQSDMDLSCLLMTMATMHGQNSFVMLQLTLWQRRRLAKWLAVQTLHSACTSKVCCWQAPSSSGAICLWPLGLISKPWSSMFPARPRKFRTILGFKCTNQSWTSKYSSFYA